MMKNQNKEAVTRKVAGGAATSSQQTASQDVKRGPVVTLRVGDVSASVWKREHQIRGESTAFYSVTLERSFRDRDGAYRYTKSFDPDSLGTLISVIQQADQYLRKIAEGKKA